MKLANGKRVLLVSQKSGVAHGLDPDHEGKVLWETRVGKGGSLGGIQWGSAADGKNMYVALSDIDFIRRGIHDQEPLLVDPKAGGGFSRWTHPPERRSGPRLRRIAATGRIAARRNRLRFREFPAWFFPDQSTGTCAAYSTEDGKVVWDFDTAREFTAVNGIPAKGGSMDGPGPVIAGGMLFVSSGTAIGAG